MVLITEVWKNDSTGLADILEVKDKRKVGKTSKVSHLVASVCDVGGGREGCV